MGWQDDTIAAASPARAAPAWERDQVVGASEKQPFSQGTAGALRQHFAQSGMRAADSFEDYLKAGWQQSVTGLATRGKAPDVAMGEDSPWYGRLLSSVTGIAGDSPAMVIGFAGGAPVGAAAGGTIGTAVPVIGNVAGAAAGTVVGGFAGAAGLPAGLRAAMMEAYTKGEVRSSADFIERALHIAWETSKGLVIGGATGGAGIVAKAAIPVAAPALVRAAGVTGSEVATMTTVAKGMEGQLPEPQDFLDAAILIGGVKASGSVATRLRAVYAKTGISPEQVVADAAINPALKAELTYIPELEVKQLGVPSPESLARAEPVSEARIQEVNERVSRAQAYLDGANKAGDEAHIESAKTALFEAVKEKEATFQAARDASDIPIAYRPAAAEETARAIVPGDKTQQVAEQPFAYEIPQAPGEPAKPTHVNYNMLNSTEDAKLAMARLSEVYKDEIQAQRRGTVSWEETSAEAAKILSDNLGGVDAKLFMPREPGTAAGVAEILARKQMTVGAAEAMMSARDNLLAKVAEATAEDRLQFLASIERASIIQSEFLGARAEAGRALNILKSTAMDADRIKLIQQVIDQYGNGDPVQLAQMMKAIDTPAGALKFAREAVKATTWEKIVEAWKASILSGPVTHAANIMGNTTFAFMRAPIDAVAAAIGKLRGAEPGQRVEAVEPIARLVGLFQGTSEGLRQAGEILKTGEQPGKSEQFRKAIEGTKGEVIRLPFRALSAEDAVFSAMNQRGETYAMAVRQASKEGLNLSTREFRERVAQLAQTPTAEIAKAAEDAGKRFTFNTELGEKGQAVQKFVRAWHLEWAVPFIRTPGNVAKELARLTPLAPLVKEFREDIAAGGARRDKAMAEIAVGSAVMATVFAHAREGNISGAGEPDQGKKRVQKAAGWQPYSIKIGDTWYSYQRLQPLGTLMGMAADVSEVWDHLTEEESDKAPKMLSVAFANAVTNQTFLQGITNVVNAMSDPTRFGPKLAQQYVGSVVPAIIAQPTQMFDPVVREVDSMVEAVKARIPGMRQTLLQKLDIFGEPEQAKERMLGISPVQESNESDDKVRTEAARLGLSVADTPKKTHIGRISGKSGDVKLEPEERDRFADIGGHLAYQLLQPIVNDATWEALPDLAKKRVYQKVFAQAHRSAAAQSMDPEKRIGLALDISEKVMQALQPEAAEAR